MKPIPLQPDLVDQVFQTIRDAICTGDIPPGGRINQDELAASLKVSRQPIVQAIQLLKSQGFVRDTGRRGVEVVPLDKSFALHLYQVRAALDGLAAREAALGVARRGAAAGDKARGTTLIKAGRAAYRTGKMADLIRADMDFHAYLYELSENPIIDEAIAPYWHHISRLMASVWIDLRPTTAVWKEHREILAAVLAGDAHRAETLAKAHAENAGAKLFERLDAAANPQAERAPCVAAGRGG